MELEEKIKSDSPGQADLTRIPVRYPDRGGIAFVLLLDDHSLIIEARRGGSIARCDVGEMLAHFPGVAGSIRDRFT